MNSLPVLPTPLEQLRAFAQCLDLPISNKKVLDDKVYDKNVRMELISSMTTEILNNLKSMLPIKLGVDISNYFFDYVNHYLKKCVGIVSFDGISRDELLPILTKHAFSTNLVIFLTNELSEEYQFDNLKELFCYDKKSVNIILNWLDDNQEWQSYLSTLKTKEEKDKIERWRRGEYLPSFQAIKLISKQKSQEWEKIKFWLLVARALDEIRKLDNGKELFEYLYKNYQMYLVFGLETLKVETARDFDKEITQIRNKHTDTIKQLSEFFVTLNFDLLSLKTEKTTKMKERAYQKLSEARTATELNTNFAYKGQHWDWLEARFHLFSGDLEKSIDYYKKAFENSLFCMGDNLKYLIQEALVATAYYEKFSKTAQRKFLAHLKNASIVFGYELPAINKESLKINHKDTVADWEVEMWANQFHYMFPSNICFSLVEYPNTNNYKNHVVTYDSIKKIKPDYKNPNKLVQKNGEKGSRKIPQLQFFILFHNPSISMDNFEIIKKLLELGADVNQLSTSNESALLLALDALNLEESSTNQDRRIFDLIAQYPHNQATINTKATKQEKYPLMQAVMTGRPDIVQKVLEMGAIVDDVNSLKMTPLHQAVSLLGKMTIGQEKMKQMIKSNHEFNSSELEYLRRLNASYGNIGGGVFYGSEKSKSKQIFQNREFAILANELLNAIVDLEYENFNKYSSIQKMEQIVCLLLDKGANPNHPHNIESIQGYTPLMLAIEHNNPTIFNKMIEKGGDISLTCYMPRKGEVTCQQIKDYWKSDKINW